MSSHGTKLNQLRIKAKLSQQEVSDFIGVSRSTYNSWESDQSTYKVEYIKKLCDVFNVSPFDLLPYSNSTNFVNTEKNIIDFDDTFEAKKVYKDLIKSKDEIILLLKKQIQDLNK